MKKFLIFISVVIVFCVLGVFVDNFKHSEVEKSTNDRFLYTLFSSKNDKIDKESDKNYSLVYYFSDKNGNNVSNDEYEEEPNYLCDNRYKVKKSSEYGVVDLTEKYILPPKYSSVSCIGIKNQNYFLAKSSVNKKSYVFDSNGNEILQSDEISRSRGYFIFKDFNEKENKFTYSVYDSYLQKIFEINSYPEVVISDNLAIVKEGEKDRLITKNGEKRPLLYDKIYCLCCIDGKNVFAVRNGKFWGAVDENNRPIVAVDYDSIFYNSAKKLFVVSKNDEKVLYFDPNGNPVNNVSFSNNNLEEGSVFSPTPVRKIHCENSFYTIVDENGKPISNEKYRYISPLHKKYLKVLKKNKYAVMDMNGKIVVPFGKYDDFHSEALYIFGTKTPYYFFDFLFFKFVAPSYSKMKQKNIAEVYENYGKTLQNRKITYTLFNENMKKMCKFSSSIRPRFIDKDVILIAKNKHCYYLINPKGKPLFRKKYEYLKFLNWERMSFVAKKHGKVGVISKNGKTLIPFKYEDISCYCDMYYAKKNGKWGVINAKNKVILPFVSFEPPKIINDNLYVISEKVELSKKQK